MINNNEKIKYLKALKEMIKRGGPLLTAIAISFTLGRCSVKDNTVEINELPSSTIETEGETPNKENEEYVDITYIVEAGDTLESIANKFDTTVDVIVSANKINNKNIIYVGSNIIIPDVKSEIASIYYEEEIKRVKVEYTVKEGDTLESIAKKFDVSKDQIVNENNIINENTIYVGESLTIPNVSILIYEDILKENENILPETVDESQPAIETINSANCVNLEDGYIRIIDISERNEDDKAINWEELEEEFKNGTFTHIIMRINENYNPNNNQREFVVDKCFEKNLSECNKRKIPYGVYSFSRGTTYEEINTETESLINYINDNLNITKEVDGEILDLTFNLSLPIYMDCFEDDARNQYQLYLDGKYDYCSELVKLWCDNMEEAGYFTGVYCMNSAYQALGSNRLSEFTLWIADYGREIYDDAKNIGLNGKVELNSLIKGQQVTSKGNIKGIDGYVDVNVFDEDLPKIVEAFYTNPNKVKTYTR